MVFLSKPTRCLVFDISPDPNYLMCKMELKIHHSLLTGSWKEMITVLNNPKCCN